MSYAYTQNKNTVIRKLLALDLVNFIASNILPFFKAWFQIRSTLNIFEIDAVSSRRILAAEPGLMGLFIKKKKFGLS